MPHFGTIAFSIENSDVLHRHLVVRIESSMSDLSVSPLQVRRLTTSIIRPYRSTYSENQLPKEIQLEDGTTCPRESIVVLSPNGKKMPGSLIRPKEPAPTSPILIYSHGNAMDQTAGMGWFDVPAVLSHGIAFCSFDFAGCGNGEEELITMGIREKDELGCVIDHLKANYGFQTVILWGLSMGGATTILTASERDDIAVAVIDSAYASLYSFLRTDPETYEEVRKEVQERAGVDINNCDCVKAVSKIRIPICFMVGSNDRVVPMSNGESLFEACQSPQKQLFTFNGPHVGYRGTAMEDSLAFVLEALKPYGVK